MKELFSKILTAFFLLLSLNVFALEIDEKLTLRILKISNTGKTVLINRGVEDGLSVGDHAKFFLTIGVVARGAVIKTSPTRSVWSLYRLVNKEYIKVNQVLNLKIASAIKITSDPSKDITRRRKTSWDLSSEDILLARGAKDLPAGSGLDKAELAALQQGLNVYPTLTKRPWEMFGSAVVNAMSAVLETDEVGVNEVEGSMSFIDLLWGFTYYWMDVETYFRRFSPYGHLHWTKQSYTNNGRTEGTSINTEIGFGVDYHPWAEPKIALKLIPFFQFGFARGKVSEEIVTSSGIGDEDPLAEEITGDSGAFIIGAGFKYYLIVGFGARVMIDFYRRSEKFNADELGIVRTRTLTGPRIQLGLNYRF